MERKSDKVRRLVADGDFKGALRIAKDFRLGITKEQSSTMTRAYAAGTLTLNVPAGTQRVAIACIATAKGVTKVINETAMNADVTSTFTKSTVSVEGANGYAAKDYNVWVFEPAVAYGNAAVLKVTLG